MYEDLLYSFESPFVAQAITGRILGRTSDRSVHDFYVKVFEKKNEGFSLFKNEKTKQGRKRVKNFCKVLLRKGKRNGKWNERRYKKR